MPTAQLTPAGEALRAMLPERSDPYAMINLACRAAFLVRDGQLLPDLVDLAVTDRRLSAALIVSLAALVDIDERPDDLLAWLGTPDGRDQETARMRAATAETRAAFDAATAETRAAYDDTLPPVTMESMRDMIHAARVAGVQHPCGTPAAYRRHVKQRQKACPRCTWAWWLYSRATVEERALLKAAAPDVDRRHPPTVRASGPGKCGTVAGYDTHRENRETPCQDCLLAAVEVVSRLKPTRIRRSCGSHGGYVAHKKNKENVCDPCGEAQTRYDAEQYDKRLARQGKTRVRGVDPGAGTVHQLADARPGDRQQAA